MPRKSPKRQSRRPRGRRPAGAESLRQSEERQRLMISSVKDYAIFMLDPTGRVETWNDGAEALKQYKGPEIIGSHISRFYPPEEAAAGRPQRLLDTAARLGRVEDEGWRVRKDGTRFWADVVITALRDSADELVGFTKVTRDLTARRAAEEELRQSEERLRLMLSSVKDYAIFRLDRSGRIETWSEGAQAVKQYTAEQAVGKHFSMFYTPEERAAGRPMWLLGQAAQLGRIEDVGWRVRKDGTRFWADVILSAIRGPSGTLLGFTKVTRDLSEQKRAEEERLRLAQSEEALRLRDEFLSIASHELRTPLTSLKLQLQSIQEQVTQVDDKLGLRLERANRSGQRLEKLVETLLDVSRISTGRFNLELEELDLAQLCREVVESFAQAAVTSGCALELQVPEQLMGSWDRLRIEQVISNLLSNALKYAPGRPVLLTLTREEGTIRLMVEDRGPGIRESDLPRIFDRFERAAADYQGGLGLGLYIAKQIAQVHQGTITAENREGGGARFTLHLPVQPGAEADASAEASLQ